VRGDLTLKRDGATLFDDETEAYMNGEISWAEYMFSNSEKRDLQGGNGRTYATLAMKGNRPAYSNSSSSKLAVRDKNTPSSCYLLFGAAPPAPRTYANEAMQKLANNVCFENTVTKHAHPKSKLRMLTYAEAEILGCKKRASPAWIKMTGMSAAAFQPPCHGLLCCKVADIVSDSMLCDGGGAAVPTCNTTTCKWSYDCTNATIEDDNGSDNVTTLVIPQSVYRKSYSRATQDGESQYNEAIGSGSSSGLSLAGKIGIGTGVSVVVGAIIVVLVVKNGRKKVETV